MKTCSKCAEAKPLSEFHRNSARCDGRMVHCKVCNRARAAKWLAENRERNRLRSLAHARANKSAAYERVKNWRVKNRERRNASERARPKDNVLNAARRARYRAAQLQASPTWLTAIHRAQMQEFYDVSVALTTQTDIVHHVDHIHPLRAAKLRGLHVPWNMQVLTARANQTKNAHVDYARLELATEPPSW